MGYFDNLSSNFSINNSNIQMDDRSAPNENPKRRSQKIPTRNERI